MTAGVDSERALALLDPSPGLVVLMCGLAGSGKTTFSEQLEAKGFLRLSMDEEVWNAGRFGLDFPAEDYPKKLDAARTVLRRRLVEALERRTPAVVDSAFWNRAARDDYKGLVERGGGSWRLIYLEAGPDLLRARLRERSGRFDANAQFEVTDTMLERFRQSFETPVGEGELVVAA